MGYNTYYVGKLFNAQRIDNYHSPHAAGWTGSDFLLDPYTYEYLNATFQRNRDRPVSYEGQHSTDVLAEKAYGFLDEALGDEEQKPFFLTIAPTAPHSNVHINVKNLDGEFTKTTATQGPPVPADRHKHLFKDVKVPRTPHFNPDEPNGVSWISRLPQQNETNVEFNDDFYRNRLRTLQVVDEIVDEVVARLDQAGVLEDTYIFYSTDNGYHIGQHRLQPGKQCAYEEDINIPLIVRGPDVPKGGVTEIVTSHTDLAPTFMQLAGAKLRKDLDGAAIPLTAAELEAEKETRQEHVNVEMWGIIMSEGKYGSTLYRNHTYKALRVVGEGYSYLYTVWCSGEHELYDLKVGCSVCVGFCEFTDDTADRSIRNEQSLPCQRGDFSCGVRLPDHGWLNGRYTSQRHPHLSRYYTHHLAPRYSAGGPQDVQSTRMHPSMGGPAPGRRCSELQGCVRYAVR